MARKIFIGKVISNKMSKTVVVEIERRVAHPVYKKIIKRFTKIKADTNNLEVNLGQNVKIEQSKPISLGKHFKVIEVVNGKGENK